MTPKKEREMTPEEIEEEYEDIVERGIIAYTIIYLNARAMAEAVTEALQ